MNSLYRNYYRYVDIATIAKFAEMIYSDSGVTFSGSYNHTWDDSRVAHTVCVEVPCTTKSVENSPLFDLDRSEFIEYIKQMKESIK